ncbi:TetR/AcrR family transcriptional regulator [Nocardia fusca]|uniref:TetR/AcrR family transcriptional regulator n=1 Tax=Nocardia fusca TaxID=941183 RepID=UPI0037AD7ABE
MSAELVSSGSRRESIADAGIRIISRDGVRALTHRAVDREAQLPQGSTSYHAKTRAALLELIVDVLTSRTKLDTEALGTDLNTEFADEDRPTVDQLAALLAALVDTLTARQDDMRARYALILELNDVPDLRQKLIDQSDVNAAARLVATRALAKTGLPNWGAHVDELLSLTDSLVFYRTAVNPTVDLQSILARYLRGATHA